MWVHDIYPWHMAYHMTCIYVHGIYELHYAILPYNLNNKLHPHTVKINKGIKLCFLEIRSHIVSKYVKFKVSMWILYIKNKRLETLVMVPIPNLVTIIKLHKYNN